MSTNKPLTPAKKAPKPRMTAEERRALREAQRLEKEQEQERARQAFEKERPQTFRGLMLKAMQLELQIQGHPDVRESNDWWFRDFHVDPFKMAFRTEAGGHAEVTQETLQLGDVQHIESGLDMALNWVKAHLEMLERRRREAEELARKRAEALSKLSDEDKTVLGLR
jgi:hypothetical protein